MTPKRPSTVRRRKRRRSARSAFTLIELLAAVVLIALMASIVAPRVGNLMPLLQTRDVSGRVAEMLKRAQLSAANAGRAVYVQYDLSGNAVRIVQPSLQDQQQSPPLPLPEGSRIASVSYRSGQSVFAGKTAVPVMPCGYILPHSVDLEGPEQTKMKLTSAFLRTTIRRD